MVNCLRPPAKGASSSMTMTSTKDITNNKMALPFFSWKYFVVAAQKGTSTKLVLHYSSQYFYTTLLHFFTPQALCMIYSSRYYYYGKTFTMDFEIKCQHSSRESLFTPFTRDDGKFVTFIIALLHILLNWRNTPHFADDGSIFPLLRPVPRVWR